MDDATILGLYKQWSEEVYCAGFMRPTPGGVAEFRRWLVARSNWREEPAESYELTMLAEYHRQEPDA